MLEVKNLTAQLGTFLLQDISFFLPKGKHLAIVGPTGAGKTSLMEILAGVKRHQQGYILLEGKDITHLPPHKREISMLYQHLSLFPHYNVKGNITYPLRWKKHPGVSFDEIVEKLKIKHLLHRNIHNLSGGEKQRVALARALITKPKILMLDEPLSSIDVVTKEEIISVIKDIQNNFMISTIIITHSPTEAYVLSDFIAIIRNGRLIHYGTKENIWQNPIDPWFARMIGIKNIIPFSQWEKLYPQIKYSKSFSHIGIHPVDIKLAKSQPESIGPTGIITNIIDFPEYCEIEVTVQGIKLYVNTKKDSCSHYNIGKNIYVYIPNNKFYLLKEGAS